MKGARIVKVGFIIVVGEVRVVSSPSRCRPHSAVPTMELTRDANNGVERLGWR